MHSIDLSWPISKQMWKLTSSWGHPKDTSFKVAFQESICSSFARIYTVFKMQVVPGISTFGMAWSGKDSKFLLWMASLFVHQRRKSYWFCMLMALLLLTLIKRPSQGLSNHWKRVLLWQMKAPSMIILVFEWRSYQMARLCWFKGVWLINAWNMLVYQ